MSGCVPPALSQPLDVQNSLATYDSVVVGASAPPNLAGSACPEPFSPSPSTSPALDVIAEPLSVNVLSADASLTEELAAISSNLETLLEEESQPASPAPQRIIFNRYRVGAEPDVSAVRLMIFQYLKCLFEAAPAADSPLVVAWAELLVDFDSDLLYAKVSRALDEVIPVISVPKSHRRTTRRPLDNNCGEPLSRREVRKHYYATYQKLFKKNPKRVLEKILDPPSEGVPFPPPSHFSDFWKNVMSLPAGAGSDPDFPDDSFDCDDLSGLWSPIETFKLISLHGALPTRLLQSCTVFIPKTSEAAEPGEFRPISMTSTVTRIFHKILAARLSKLLKLSEEQRAFVSTDGLSQNVILLDLIIQNAKIRLSETHVDSIDLVKAFDSVSHNSIYSAIRALNLPFDFERYIKDLYEGSTTIFQFPGSEETPFHQTCGVRQGDPLSPLLFNMVIEFLIRKLRSYIGIDVDGTLITASAFADDLLLFASTKMGLQLQLDKTVAFLGKCNLVINAQKSFTFSFLVDGRNSRLKIVDSKFIVSNCSLRSMKPGGNFKYLGVYFRTDGLMFFSPVEQIKEWLVLLAKAPLKPQQRLFLLREHLIPKLLHLSVLSRIRVGVLNKVDRVIRAFLRKHLDLPHDAVNAFFHADFNDGGLAIPSFRAIIPEMRLKRLNNVKLAFSSNALSGFVNEVLHTHIRNAMSIALPGSPSAFWRIALLNSVDGAGLSEASKTPGQFNWSRGANLFMSGKDFILCTKLKYNALPSRSRCGRGRNTDRLCRAGCARSETTGHILQVCPRTHGMRVRRHDAIINYAIRGLEQRGFVVAREPLFSTAEGRKKPDLVATKGSSAFIIDAQVVSDSELLRRAHRRKVDKYEDLAPLVLAQFGIQSVLSLSLTLN
ncbi:hypothetical protein JTE90_004026 [Oedothorax gibbosus]|uniref:Reverse transcriptase domain-containing protein n=1 Tax=Oedothorax gibbosus TaxID=931172 RepID=A0AAV6U5S8_9ARAC|nr:hypothetical protein JTE90_004026 [Oedothorax gibbosus]